MSFKTVSFVVYFVLSVFCFIGAESSSVLSKNVQVSLAESRRVKRIVGGYPASSPPPPDVVGNLEEDSIPDVPSSTTSTTPEPDFDNNDAIVFTRRGSRRAQVNGVKEKDGYFSFKGIKYAQAPEGRLRFQRPIRVHMFGTVDAKKFPPPCPQPLPNNRGYVGKEDCLYLNVFTPKIPLRGQKKSQGYPVIFWVHGGGFRRGSANQYGVKDFVRKDVVIVTVQYRLGSLGFLSLKNKELPGNVGLFDINAAMRWVKEYIRYFGGNPKRIIPSGQGVGASAAGVCASNRYNEDSVKGVFAMSGSPVSSFAFDDKEADTSKSVSALNSCGEEEGLKLVRCLQKVPVEKIIEADSQLQDQKIQDKGAVKGMAAPLNPSPSVDGEDDGRFLPYFVNIPPIDALKSGRFLKVPLLTGITKEETSTAVKGGFFSEILGKVGEAGNLLTDVVMKDLLNVNTGLYSNGSVNPSLNTLFSNTNYLSAISNSLTSAASSLDKFIEATTDAIFNLPAYLTSQLWAKKSTAFLYLFDYESKKSTGKQFLDGLPLVQTTDNVPSKGLSHGDDLIFLFDPCTLEGEPIASAQLTAEKDKKVREHFTSMVAEFARSGTPKIKSAGIGGWSSFSSDSSEYLVLSDKPSVQTGFRKCQMALWAGIGETLKSAECSALGAGELLNQLGLSSSGLLDQISLGSIGSSLTDPIRSLTDPLSTGISGVPTDTSSLTNSLGLGGLLGGGGGGGGGGRKTTPKPAANSNPLGGLNIFG